MSRWLALVFSSPCRLCGGRVHDTDLGAACQACWESLDAESLPEVHTPALAHKAFDRVQAAFAYAGPLRELLHAWKFEGKASLRRPLGRRLAQRCASIPDWNCDKVIPVPDSKEGQAERGYSPAKLLAASLNLPLDAALRWTRVRQRQSTLNRAQRLDNAEGGMRADASVQGKRVLVVDDILSSGATAQEAARALKIAGASFVGVAVLAHAVAD